MFKTLDSLIDIFTSQFIPEYRTLRGGYYTQLYTKIDSSIFSICNQIME